MWPLQGKLLAGRGGTFRAEAASRQRGSVHGLARPPGCHGPRRLQHPLSLGLSLESPATRQCWQMISTHTTVGQLSPCPIPS